MARDSWVGLQEDRVTRIEVIDGSGRAFVAYYEPGEGAEVHLQDHGRTLKVFAGVPTQGSGT